jgi:hypothetical protein
VAARAAHVCLALMTRRRHGPGGEVPTGNVGSAWAAWLPCAAGGLNFLRVDLGGPWRRLETVPFGGSRQKVPCPWPPLAPWSLRSHKIHCPWNLVSICQTRLSLARTRGEGAETKLCRDLRLEFPDRDETEGLLEGKDGGERVRRRGRKSRRAPGRASRAEAKPTVGIVRSSASSQTPERSVVV